MRRTVFGAGDEIYAFRDGDHRFRTAHTLGFRFVVVAPEEVIFEILYSGVGLFYECHESVAVAFWENFLGQCQETVVFEIWESPFAYNMIQSA